MLLFAQRTTIHRAVAKWYEQTYGGTGPVTPGDQRSKLEPYFTLLAYHYRQAEDAEHERRYTRLAGEHAAAQFANAEAIAFYSRTLELTPQQDVAERYDILLAREQVYDLQGQRESSAGDLSALAALADQLGDDRRRATVALRRAHHAQLISDYDTALKSARQAAGFARSAQAAEIECAAYLESGLSLWKQGNYPVAREQLRQALDLARGHALNTLEAESLHGLGLVNAIDRDSASAARFFQQALEIARVHGDRRVEGRALTALGTAAWYQGDLVSARSYSEQALEICRTIGDRRGEGYALGNLGYYDSAAFGDYSGAQGFLEQALAIFRAIGDGEGWVLHNLGDNAVVLGRYAVASEHYAQARAIARAIGSREDESNALRGLGTVAHHTGDDTTALEWNRQALDIATEIGFARGRCYALINLGQALSGQRKLAEAAAAYADAYTLGQELSEPTLVLEAIAGQSTVALAGANLGAALRHAEEILRLFSSGDLAGANEPAQIELTCYQVLRAAGDERAHAVLEAAHARLQDRATRIADAALHQSFLDNVVAHRTIATAFAEVAA